MEIPTTYKRNGTVIPLSGKPHGINVPEPAPYRFPKGHPCHGCPFMLGSTVPGCMFPSNGGKCFRYKYMKRKNQAPDIN